ncbi:PAS domain-containing sensor histidine kinase [Halopenitus sp. H-Gu1]|uniref:PAS domain-containing sensor histidine kinase n=1 Tax=Halopenitus sp. H-Gu1 TaxID=3242697 RepID=UPI00359ED366
MGVTGQTIERAGLTPFWITIVFVIFGSVWILVTDWMVTAIFGISSVTAQTQLMKGLLFVSGSGIFIFVLLSRRDDSIQARTETIRNEREEIQELEAEVRESEQRLSLILSHVTETVLLTDDTGNFTYVCPNVHYIFGYTVEDVREMGTIDELLGADPTPPDFSAGDLIENIELEVTDADDRNHTVLVTINSVSIQDGSKLFTVRDVTDRVESERKLAVERERLKAVVSNAPLILTALDNDGTITVSEGRQLEPVGLDSGEMVGKSVFDVFDEYPVVRENAKRVLGGESFTTTTHIEGHIFDVWHEPVFENGAVDHAIVVAQDITERVRQEEQFQAFVEGSSDIITVLDSDGNLEYVSPSVERILGYEPEELMNENAFDIVHPDDRDQLRETFAKLLEGQTETTFSTEHRIRHADGSWRWAESRVTSGESRALDGYVVNTRDITDRVQAERKLRRIDESRSLALTAAQAGVWEWDIETDHVTCHESCERLFGLEPGTFEGTFEAFADRIHPDDLADVEAALERAVERTEPFDMTFRIIRDDGAERWIDSRSTILTDHAGEPERLLGVNVDVTELRNWLQQLQVMERVLRHNLRNDLGIVRGYAETIQQEAPDPLATQAKQIVDHSNHLLSLAEKQRKITQILSAEPQLNSVNAVQIIRDQAEMLSSEYPEARINLHLPDEATVLATEGLATAIEELVRNSIIHTDQDVPTVDVTVTETDSRVDIHVSDTGPGIPEMEQQVVAGEEEIEPLYHGSGLGLWLVSWIVRRSSGTLSFGENEPRGSIVTISLQKEPVNG